MTEAEWLSGADPAPLLRFAEGRLADRHRLLFMAGCCRRVWDLLTDPRLRRVVELAEELADGRAAEAELAAAAEELPRPGFRTLRQGDRSRPEDWASGQAWVTIGGRNPMPTRPGVYVADFQELPVWCQRTYHAVAAIARREYLTVAEQCEMAAAHHAEEQLAARHPLHDEVRRLEVEVRAGYGKAEDYRRRGAARLGEEALEAARALERKAGARSGRLANEIWSAGAAERVARAAAERAAQADLVRCLVGNPFRAVAVDPGWLTATVVGLARGIDADRAFDRLPILADALQDAGCDSDTALSHCRGEHAHTRGCWVVELLKPRKS